MTAHAFFSPSKANMWMACPGAMAFPENQRPGKTSEFADEGSAAHHFAAAVLQDGPTAKTEDYIGVGVVINGKRWECTQDMADAIQVYIDDVRRRQGSGILLVEQQVDLSKWLGPEQFGTADAIIIDSDRKLVIVEDLKFGRGERVTAEMPVDEAIGGWKMNPQCALYAMGALELIARNMLAEVDADWQVQLVISQPRVDQRPSEFTVSVAGILSFAGYAKIQAEAATRVLAFPPHTQVHYEECNPTKKGCRWCQAQAVCPALAKRIAEEVRVEFDHIPIEAPHVPRTNDQLSLAYAVMPMIQNWCRAVEAEVYSKVIAGETVNGSDGLPLKMVEGRQGSRQWQNPEEVETFLQEHLGDKAYEHPKLISASVASKLLDRKATKDIWQTVFMPLIKRAPGKPVLAQGSDERPAYVGDVTMEFTEIQPEE